MRHVAAGFGASAASLRALVAVIGAMFVAFRAAGVADLRAEGADLGGELGAARHLARGKSADLGATATELNAAHHHMDVGFAQAGRRAALAGLDTVVAD